MLIEISYYKLADKHCKSEPGTSQTKYMHSYDWSTDMKCNDSLQYKNLSFYGILTV